jgi:hypothetical protein
MSEKNRVLELYERLKSERVDYISRARKIGFKPEVPKLPENKNDYSLLNSTLSGYQKRFSNWKINFDKFERTKLEEEIAYSSNM